METRISDSLVTRRSPALLAALFSAIALLLTAIGTYGVLSYSVSQRRREIGVRMALGAQPSQIRAQFLSLALRLLAVGSILGIFGAWLAGSAMQTVLFHVPAAESRNSCGSCGGDGSSFSSSVSHPISARRAYFAAGSSSRGLALAQSNRASPPSIHFSPE